jgi:HtrA serine peptidase 2
MSWRRMITGPMALRIGFLSAMGSQGIAKLSEQDDFLYQEDENNAKCAEHMPPSTIPVAQAALRRVSSAVKAFSALPLQVSYCDSYSFTENDTEDPEYDPTKKKGLSTADSMTYLRRNFVAEAADIVAPAVVNIICDVNSFIGHGASSGSGFIYSKDGYIVTNAHVVAPSADGKVLVTMWNGRKRSGVVHSLDKMSDIALVKLTDVGYDEDLPTATMGHSGRLHIGEFVIALGSPLLLQNSITFGIVSALARHGSELGMAQNRTEFIQTDAAINVGNSGGPLVNLDGEVVGINSMKVRDSDGVSFAIPIDMAQQVIKQLIVNKRVIRPYVGLKMINYSPTTGSKARRNGITLKEDTSVLVVEVERDSPAHRAGVQR